MTDGTTKLTNFCFTVNNPSDVGVVRLDALSSSDGSPFKYLIYGKESASTGTPHLQGYAQLTARTRFNKVREHFIRLGFAGTHIERARGSADQNIVYCSKDGEFKEYGTRPTTKQGKRTDLERLRDEIEDGERCRKTLRANHTAALRFPHAMELLLADNRPEPVAPDITLRKWQSDLVGLVRGEPIERKVHVRIDTTGGAGKSTFARYLQAVFPRVQLLHPAKHHDLSYLLQEENRVFILDVPRSSAEFVPWPVIEHIKDGFVISTKYQPIEKHFGPSHVIVFTNEYPDKTKLSLDRWDIISI